MALTPEVARRLFRLLIGAAVAALVVGTVGGVLAWVPVWSGPDPSRDPQWWWHPSYALILVGICLTVSLLTNWWLAKRRMRSR